MRVHFLVLLAAAPLCAQPVTFGGKIGVPLADPMGRYGESRPYSVGPSVEIRLPAGFAIEGSALYRRIGSTVSYYYGPPEFTSYLTNRVRGNAWEFPVIGKYYFRERRERWQPYIGTGWSMQTVGWQYQGSTSVLNSAGTPVVTRYEWRDRSELNVGATVVTGVRVRAGRMSLLPEIRLTRWGSNLQGFAANRKNDAGVYLGIRF
jgi:hypothetical protein